MFDVTGMELVVLIGAASIFLGKKELPQLARIAGRGTGKVVALLNTAREQFTKATQDTQFSKLHDEVRQNMYELNSIRSEVRSAGLQQQPGAMSSAARRAMMADAGAQAQALKNAAGADIGGVGGVGGANMSAPSSFAFPSPTTGGFSSAATTNEASGSIKGIDKKKLGELAMAELLWQETAQVQGGGGGGGGAGGGGSGPAAASPPSPQQSGSDVLEDVLMEKLLRDHVDRFAAQERDRRGGGGGGKA